jgi:superfamily II DNA or RNA helicase
MLNQIIFPFHRRYKSGTEWEPIGFFSECLCNSTRFDLMLGFFSSSAIRILASGFAVFLYNGGKMRMIINNLLSPQDKQTIIAGQSNTISDVFDLSDISSIQNNLSDEGRHFFECLAWLISNKRIEIKIVQPKDHNGIAHTKFGLFTDTNNKVSFEGSCNFTRAALIENIESFSVSCDWDGEIFKSQIENIENDFEKAFEENDKNLIYINAEKVIDRISTTFGGKDLAELLEQEQQISQIQIRPSILSVIKTARKKVADIAITDDLETGTPHFPYPSGPRDYQKQAFENWKANEQKGLFAMATGTGKTLTALNCLLEIYRRKGYYKALILVPTLTLVEQWENECRKFGYTRVIKVSSKNSSWREEINRVQFDEKQCKEDDNVSYIIIATYSSFARQNVFDTLNSFSRNQMLLIADEAHNMGAPGILKKMGSINYLRRIGLSATPERQFDEQNNLRIARFFGAEEKYTYEYSMEEAIKKGVLCRYYYYPHVVQLTDDEMEHYAELSTKISRYFNFNSGTFDKKDDVLMALLLARKRIIHKASNKLPVFQQIISNRFVENGSLKYTLVYVPEGNNPDEQRADVFEDHETITDDQDAEHLIDIYTQAVCDVDKYVTVRKFTGDTKDRDAILDDFASGRLQVLTSMKCLDEGVDVPRSELAIFCASTGNPRQFIQRRGRVLRTHKDKKYSYIHDLVVIPRVMPDTQSYRMEQALLAGELKRVYDFSYMSENPSQAQMELIDVMNYYGLNMFDNTHINHDTER